MLANPCKSCLLHVFSMHPRHFRQILGVYIAADIAETELNLHGFNKCFKNEKLSSNLLQEDHYEG